MANSESEGFPSRKDVQEYLVLNDESFESKLRELKNKEVIKLYQAILKETGNDDSIVDKDRLDEIIELMNKKTIIQHYNKGTLSSLDSDMFSVSIIFSASVLSKFILLLKIRE